MQIHANTYKYTRTTIMLLSITKTILKPRHNIALKPTIRLATAWYHEAVVDHYENPRNVGRLDAKKQNVKLTDYLISCACSDACPSGVISFGDLNDNDSEVNKISKNNRSYHALEEIGVKPNIFYMTKVRNVDSH